ncbi:EthD family reductase [Paenarthrobacter sp. AT5]|uniref:EthD family reductase n=1 Tax=Paenarthrobacter TaxID=1742992 RepID=UPI001A99C528|nr:MULTISPECIES: EthD family reductase [Paenarthrobacter]QSZ53932.1 ethyl tert-butyl ether degradation protein EthD [Paenarthrobacter ureafaciens]WOC62713.1 EthD family reductase [Paenarthrobacter sp. AT5]
MHKIIVLYPEPADRDAFIEYYESTHLPLAMKLPGLRSWRYTTNISPGAGGGPSPYFAIFEAEFNDAGELQAAMASPEGQAVAADVPNYATGGALVLDYAISGGSGS